MKKIKSLQDLKSHGITDQEIAIYLGVNRATIHQFRNGNYPVNGGATKKILQFIDLNKMLSDIKYKQLLDKIKDTKKYVPEWLDIYLYNDK